MADKDWKNDGLKRKYDVRKADGSSAEGKYFVLRIDRNENGEAHDPNAIRALHEYADSIQKENPKLADELKDWMRA